MNRILTPAALLAAVLCCQSLVFAADDLIGHWPLQGNARDHSGKENHGEAHGVAFSADGPEGSAGGAALFDGRDDYIEAPASGSLRLGIRDFSIALRVNTGEVLDDGLGDLIGKFDPVRRVGFNFSIMNYSGVTGSQSNYRHVHFGIDSGTTTKTWRDCGRPGDAVLVFALAVYEGDLYAGTCEPLVGQAGHVYRYDGEASWVDCGSPDKCNSVSSLAVYKGSLYAGVSRYRLAGSSLSESENPHLGGKVYRYDGEQKWVDCGQLPGIEAINGLAVYRGKLYASSLYAPAGLFRYEGGDLWTACGTPDGKRVESLCVRDGSLYATGYDEGGIYRYDGESWTHCGLLGDNTQTYSFAMYAGQMHVGTWRSGKVFRYKADNDWIDAGRLGEELEVMGMAAYNGKLYAGTLPLAEVYRHDGDGAWTLTGQLDQTPDVKYRRAWTMAVFQGKLFCGTLPSGRVYSLQAGQNVTHDKELPAGWNHLAAVRNGGQLKLYVNGELVSASAETFDPAEYDLTNEQPLRIGMGAHDYFNGSLADVRILERALSDEDVKELARLR